MTALSLAASPRTVEGKAVKRLRRVGIIPGNIYGHNIPSKAVQIPAKELELIARRAGTSGIIELRIEGEARPRNVFLRRMSYNAVSRTPLHVDLYQVRMDEMMTAEVPLHFVGEAPAVRDESGIVLELLTHLRVHGLPADIPVAINVDVSRLLHVGDAIAVRDLELPAGIEVLVAGDELVTKVNAPHVAAEDIPEETTAEPGAVAGEAAEAAPSDTAES